jgi:type II secretory pathway pseudopilin PulG
MTLIEVLVASMLVAVIAIGTFTALTAAQRSTQDARSHAEGVQLVGQDEERLRGMTVSQLAALGTVTTFRAENGGCIEEVSANKFKYWSKGSTEFCENQAGLTGTAYTGTQYTVTSASSYVTAEAGGTKTSFACETAGGATSYLQTTSTATWSALGKRPVVTQSSVVNSKGAGLLVKVVNQSNEPVSGATVAVTGATEQSQTTSASGCVIFGGLAAGNDKVTATKTGWINENGEASPTAKSFTAALTGTTELKFVIAEPGGISAEFIDASTKAVVSGTTFYAFNTGIAPPDGYVGGSASVPVTTATLPRELFPFKNVGEKPPGENHYTVFAGDCEKNNPTVVTGGTVKAGEAQVEPGLTATAKVPLGAVTVTVYEGKESTLPKKILVGPESVMMINLGCKTEKARNVTVPYEHTLALNGEGHFTTPEQPFAKELELCITWKAAASSFFKYEKTFENKAATGINLGNLFMKGAEEAKAGYSKSAAKLACP